MEQIQSIPAVLPDIEAEQSIPSAEILNDLSVVQLHALMQVASDAIISVDEHGEISFWNRGAYEMFGYTEQEARGQILSMLMPERFRYAHLRGLERVAATGVSHLAGHVTELVGLRKDGSEFPMELSVVMGETDQAMVFSGIVRDITRRKMVYEALRASEERFHAIISNTSLILFSLDHVGLFTFVEGKPLEVLGLQPEQMIGVSIFDIFQDVPQVTRNIAKVLNGEKVRSLHNVRNRTFETLYMPLFNVQDEIIGVTGLAEDITERIENEAKLRAHEKRYHKLTEQADIVLVIDSYGVYSYASPSHLRIAGYQPGELIGTPIFHKIHPSDSAAVTAIFESALRRDILTAHFECRIRHANGSWVSLECTGYNCLDDPDVQGIIVNARDISERVLMEQQMRYQLEHDTLTHLPNRTLLLQRLERALEEAKKVGGGVALLVMDLNRFKEVNDAFGYQCGDMLLQQVSARLCQIVPPFVTVARLSGDEFAVVFFTVDEEFAREHVERVHALFEAPFTIKDITLQVDISIGVTLYPAHGADGLTLMQHADIAMYAAKQSHKGYTFYEVSREQSSAHRLELIRDLRYALTDHKLMLYYQPKVELASNIVSGVEALVRWQHPVYGMVPPDQFIPLAEQTGLINVLTPYLLDKAIYQCRQWLDKGIQLHVAVNLSMWDLHEPSLPDNILSILQEYRVPPDLLCLELTESAVMTDAKRSLEVLKSLSAHGIHISIDDFGTGYSSLAYLSRLPVDEVKIDRSFVMQLCEVETDATIVRSTIALAHGLGLSVVAEGVENQATLDLLRSFDCDCAQGYYLSRPIPAADLDVWLRGKAYNHV